MALDFIPGSQEHDGDIYTTGIFLDGEPIYIRFDVRKLLEKYEDEPPEMKLSDILEAELKLEEGSLVERLTI